MFITKRHFITALLLSTIAIVTSISASPTYIHDIATQTIEGTASSPPFGWGYKYDIGFSNLEMNIQLQILLRGSAPDSSLLQTWEDGIENMWSKKFDVADRSFRYHINFDVSFTTEASGSIDQSVLVIDGQGSGNMFNWYTISDQGAEYNGQAAAHEFGHMLGLYDEYTSGMLDPSDFIDTTSIMGSLDGITYTRHYQAFLDWLQPAANGRKLSLTAYDPDWVNPTIPEPASAAIMTLGGLLFALKRRKR